MLHQKCKSKAQNRLKDYVRSRYELIRPIATQGMFNFRCYENCVEYARTHPGLQVVEVIYIDGTDPILHYVNYDPETKEYLETTLGWRAPYLEYYHIRKIHPDDYRYIGSEFDRALESWRMQFTNWFDRNVFGVDRVL